MDKRLVLVSGPSGVGKGPIIQWTKKLCLQDLCQIKVRKTATERHIGDEDNLGFNGKGGEYYPYDCRGKEQRIYLDELDNALEKHKVVLIEAYYKAFNFLKGRYEKSVDFASTFISPLDTGEIGELKKQGKLEEYLPDLMLDSLIKRAERDGKAFTKKLIKELKQRAEDSVNEIDFMRNYKNIIPNHCCESNYRWRFSILFGEPLRVVKSLKEIIERGKNG